jgi:hypothetical protein
MQDRYLYANTSIGQLDVVWPYGDLGFQTVLIHDSELDKGRLKCDYLFNNILAGCGERLIHKITFLKGKVCNYNVAL